MAQINPMVPKVRMGGKSLIVSILACVSAVYATELDKAKVGI